MGSKIEKPEIRSPPSFNSYSSNSTKLAEIAARVIRELEHVSQSDSLKTPSLLSDNNNNNNNNNNGGLNSDQNNEEQEQEEEFEFSFVSGEPNVTADEIFHNGQIKPLYYPLFNTALLEEPPRKRTPLGKLFREETGWSCSSSEAEEEEDELERVPTDSYCLWNPKEGNRRVTSSSMGKMGKKSKSTGSVSKRWKLKNILLHRSNSVDVDNNGKINNNNNNDNNDNNNSNSNTLVVLITSDHKDGPGNMKGGEEEGPTVARDIGDAKRRSYLPYRQDLVGLFANVNGLSRKLHPF